MERSAGGLRTQDADPDCDGQHSRRAGADQGEAARHRPATRTLRRLDPRAQGRRGLDLGRGGPRQLDRPLLLGKPVGELRGRRDLCLERGTTLRRERSVRERREFDDLLIGVVLCRRRLTDTATHTVTRRCACEVNPQK